MDTGKFNKLKAVKAVDFGLYLDGGDGKEILLPKRYVPEGAAVGDTIDVFIYHDNDGRLIATTEKPHGSVGEFQYMRVKDRSPSGAFLDWGIMKDLLVPFSEQKEELAIGKYYLVYIYLDFITQRVVASTRLDKFLDNLPPDYEPYQEVNLIIANQTELGYKVIIDNRHWGLIYKNQVFQPLHTGDRCKGYIREVREDDKIDVSLYPLGYDKTDGVVRQIVRELDNNNGFLPCNDKTEATEIYARFSCSKKSFKQAVGYLYRQRIIDMNDKGIFYARKQ